jgi:hypothetical protein
MNWRHFVLAAILVSIVLWRVGAPPFAIIAGVVFSLGAGLWKARTN